MREAQQVRYAEKIERVVQYLQKLDWSSDNARADVETLASVARLSPYHFHRIFRLMTGEPIGDLVRRVRVARALFAQDAIATVTDRAMISGYATPQSFARAVRDVLGDSPSVLVKRHDLAVELQSKLLRRTPSAAADPVSPLSIEIASIEPFTIHAIRNVGAYRELNQAYEKLFAIAFEHVSSDCLRGIVGVPLDDPLSIAERDCRFYCGVRLDAKVTLPAPVKRLELGAGLYVVARHIGSYDLVQGAIDAIFAALLECEAVVLANAPIHLCYLDDPEHQAECELRSDIFIPIESGESNA